MNARHSRGITLIELLVVVAILVLLGAMVVPNLTPNIEARRLREAARGVDVFLAGAKARAVRNGRPVGVMITPLESNPYAALKLSLAEVPVVYAGDLFNSTMTVTITSSPTAPSSEYYLTAVDANGMSIWETLSPGDLIQFGGKGYFYQIQTITSQTTLQLRVDTRGGVLPWPSTPTYSNPVSYKIYRQPAVYSSVYGVVGSSAGTSMIYQMPPGTAIDLVGSIFPGVTFSGTGSFPRTVVFSPGGGVASIYANQGVRYLPEGTVQLLVGKIANIPAVAPGPASSPTANWFDSTNHYVSIGHLTGQVTTNEVAPISNPSASLAAKLQEATLYTRENFSTGGR